MVLAGPSPAPSLERVLLKTVLGDIEVELDRQHAPLTVANFLRLVERRFFDGNRWHRVVPNFVVQDGVPRGDGLGGPGGAIRVRSDWVRRGPSVANDHVRPSSAPSGWQDAHAMSAGVLAWNARCPSSSP